MSTVGSVISGLKNDATTAALVGTRVFEDMADSGAALPYIVCQRIDSVRYPHLGGSSGLVDVRVQVDCTGSTRASRDAVADAVREALYGNQGTLGVAPDDLAVQNIDLDGDVNETALPTDGRRHGGVRAVFTRSMDFIVAHAETVPTF